MLVQSILKKKVVILLIALAIPPEVPYQPLGQQLIEVTALLESPIYIGLQFNATITVTSRYHGEVRLLAVGISFTWSTFEVSARGLPIEENQTTTIFIIGAVPEHVKPGMYRFRAYVKAAVLEDMRWRTIVAESKLYQVRIKKIEGEILVDILDVEHSLPESQEACIALTLINTGIEPKLPCLLLLYANNTELHRENLTWLSPGKEFMLNISVTLPYVPAGVIDITAILNYSIGIATDTFRVRIEPERKGEFNATLALLVISEANRTYNLAFSAYIKLIQDNLSAVGADLLLTEASSMLIKAISLFNEMNSTAIFYANKSIAYSRDATLLVLLRYINVTEQIIERAERKVKTYRMLGVRGEKMERAQAKVEELKGELSKMRGYALIDMDVDKTRRSYQKVLTEVDEVDKFIDEAKAEHIETRARSMTYILAQVILSIIILVYIGNRMRLLVVRLLFRVATKKVRGVELLC